MLKNSILKQVFYLLAKKYPDSSGIKNRIERGMWLDEISQLESRLFLAASIHRKWFSGPKNAAFNATKSKSPELTLSDIKQAKLFLEQYIVSVTSKKTESIDIFPFKEVISDILSFRAKVTEDPGLRMFFKLSCRGVENQGSSQHPNISMLPKSSKKRAMWYKFYGLYASLMGAVHFEENLLQTLEFNKAWLKDDEGVVLLLFSYVIIHAKYERISNVYLMSKSLEEEFPTLLNINIAMKNLLK